MDKKLGIIIADDHEIVRVGLKRLITIDKNISIMGEATTGLEAIALAEYYNPDIALLDILMPKMDGIEATKEIKRKNPHINCVILTAFEDSQHIENALEAGADGYLSKDISSRDLIENLNKVMEGERVFSRSIVSLIHKRLKSYDDSSSGSVIITKREQEIIDLVAKGMSSPEIADELCISVRTVQTHRSNVMKKLNVKNATGLVRYAIQNI